MSRTDLFNQENQLVAIVEVKLRHRTSASWAAQLRRNLLAHGDSPRVHYFCLVTPDRMYLWRGNGVQPSVVEPTYQVDAQPIFAPYFESAGIDPQEVSNPAFELIVAAWLSDVMHAEEPPERLAGSQIGLLESGFLNAIREGRIEHGLAA